MKRLVIIFAGMTFMVLTIGLASVQAKVVGKTVEYTVQGMTMKGYLAYDDNIKGKRPGVLVVQEWWGVNDYIRRRARMLAKLGYTAFAVDMYGEGTLATNPKDAGDMSAEVMKNFETTGKARFEAGEELLKKEPTVDPERIGAIGYCFGGGVVLNIATGGTDLKGIVSFHGTLGAVKPAEPGAIKAKLLVLHGGDDKFVTPEQVAAFKKEMDSAGADYKFIVYPGATHAFTNPASTANGKKFNMPIAYNKKADKESWAEMKKFLNEIFKQQ